MTIDFKAFSLPADPELFLWCHGIYHSAAGLTMPVENPASHPFIENEGKTYAFSDIPINRGMLAVTKELRETDTPEDQRMSIMTRIMQFGDVFGEPELAPFIKEGEGEGEVLISEALIKACATAKLLVENEKIKFDISDVAKLAQKITDEEEHV